MAKTKPEQNNITRAPKRTLFMRGPRPLAYDVDIAIEFCARIASGKSMRNVCKENDMPRADVIFRWLSDTSNGFNTMYDKATEARADADMEAMRDIAEDATNDQLTGPKGGIILNTVAVERAKLKVNVLQWQMGKRKPKKYGDRLDLTTLGKELPRPILSGASVADLAKVVSTDDKKIDDTSLTSATEETQNT